MPKRPGSRSPRGAKDLAARVRELEDENRRLRVRLESSEGQPLREIVEEFNTIDLDRVARAATIRIPALVGARLSSLFLYDYESQDLLLASHTHQLGRSVEVRLFDGQQAGELIYENDDWASPELKDLTKSALHIPQGSGFEFTCNFSNDTGETVHWGFSASDEMCQIAMVFTPGESSRTCDVVASSSDM